MYFKVNLQFFAEEEEKQAPQQTQDPTPEEVLDIKQNYVKKEKFEELQKNYSKLVNSVLDGGDLPAQRDPNGEKGVDKTKLRKELYDPNGSLTNLEYVEKTLKLREQIIAEGGKDPFLPTGINGNPYKNDQEQANAEASAAKVAKVLGEAVKEANGDPEAFDVIMTKIVI